MKSLSIVFLANSYFSRFISFFNDSKLPLSSSLTWALFFTYLTLFANYKVLSDS